MPTLEAQQAFQEAFGVRIPKGPMSSASPLPPAAPARGVLEKVKSAIVSVPAAAKSAVGVLSAEKAAEIESIQATRNPIKRAAKTAMLGAETVKDVGAAIARAPVRLATQVVRNAATVPATLMGKDDGVAEEYTPNNAFAKFFLGDETLGKSGSFGTNAAEASSEFALRKLDPTLADLPANDPRRLTAKFGIGVPVALFGGLLEGADAELPGASTAGKKLAKAGIKKIAKEGAEEATKKAVRTAASEAAESLFGIQAAKAATREVAEEVAQEGALKAAKPAVKAAIKELPEEVGTFVNKLGVAIHPDDAKIMEAYIDNVRLKGPANPELSLDATRIAEGYGMRMPKTEAGLANEFDDVLSRMRTQAKFDAGQAKAAVPTQAYGAAAGFKLERDEEGNIKGLEYDPKLGLVGVAGMMGAQSGPGKKIIKQLTDKFGALAASRVPAEAIEKAAREGSLEAVERLAKQNSDEIAEALSKGIDPEDLAKPNTLSPIGDALENRRRAILGSSDDLSYGPVQAASPQGTAQKTAQVAENPTGYFGSGQQPSGQPRPKSTGSSTGAVPSESSAASYNDRIADNGVFYNIDRLDISSEAKERLLETVNDPSTVSEVKKLTGKRLSNQQLIKLASESADTLNEATSVEQTKEAIIRSLNKRRQVADLFNNGGMSGEDMIREWMKSKTYNTDVARQLQALRITAGPRQIGIVDEMLAKIMKSGADPDDVAKASAGVDFKDYSQVVKWYRKFVTPTAEEAIDKLRYGSMLSSPLTHIVNITSNLGQGTVVAPTYKMVRGAVDAVRSAIDGKPRAFFPGEGIAHLKGYVRNIGNAAKRFKESLAGSITLDNADIRNIPLYTTGAKRAAERTLAIPMRLIEASDQFFTAMSQGGADEAIAYRIAKGGKAQTDEAAREAAYFLFRGKDEAQVNGILLHGIDEFVEKLNGFRNAKNVLLRNGAKFTFPFVKTPTEILKQNIEFSPLGLATVFGAKNKTEQIAKAITGSLVLGVGASQLLGSGRMTWGEPTDAEQKTAFRDAGLQPYSVKIGNKWYSYSKLPPAISFNLAILAALNDEWSKGNLDDSQFDVAVGALGKVMKFWTDQSFIKGMGDVITAVQGDEDKKVSALANYGTQLIPFRALMGWVTRIVDPVQRKADPEGTILEKQLQQVMMQIPGLSKYVPARTNKYGEEIPIQFPGFNALSPVRVTEEDPGKAGYIQEREKIRQQNEAYRQEDAKLSRIAKRETMDNAAKLSRLETPEERRDFLRSLKPEEVKAIIALKKEMALRRDAFGEEIKGYSVKNGIRAKAIVDRMETLETPEERKQLLLDLVRQKVLTKEVLKQVVQEKEARKKKEPAS